MAFRRGFRGRRRPSFGRRRAPLARVRRTWLTSINATVCDVQVIPLQVEACTTLFKIQILDNSLLESTFSDRARVRRVLGDLWFNIDPALGSDNDENFSRLASAIGQIFLGLRVGEETQLGASASPDPLQFDYDLSESRWLKTWQHSWNPFDNFEVELESFSTAPQTVTGGVCSDVHTTGAPDNIFTSGTGTIDIETDCTQDCITCTQPSTTPRSFVHLRANRVWHLHVDVRKRIPCRENQTLYLMGDVASPNPFSDFNLLWWGNIRTLVEF